MEILNYIYDKVSPIGTFSFVCSLGRNTKAQNNIDDEELANYYLNGSYYQKSQEKINQFVERCEASLDTVGTTVKRLEDEYKLALEKVKQNDPGSGPSDTFLNRNDPDAIDRYNRRVDEFNSKLEVYRRLQDQARRVKERFDDSILRYREKEADLQEQINAKKEELKPAFDQDLQLFITKMCQLAVDAFDHDNRILEGLVFSYLAKKVIVELAPRYHDANKEREANESGKKLDLQIAALLKKDERPIKDGLEQFFDFLNKPYQANLKIVKTIEEDLAQLPIKEYNLNKATVDEILGLPIIITFDYAHIIDPDELNELAQTIRARKREHEAQIAKISDLAENLAPLYEQINGLRERATSKFLLMENNKKTVMSNRSDLVLCVLEVFDDDKQDNYLPRQKRWFEDLQGYLEEVKGVRLKKLLDELIQTELGVIPMKQKLEQHELFKFLQTEHQLPDKKVAFEVSLSKLDEIAATVDAKPKENALAFSKKAQSYMTTALFPLVNLFAPIQLNSEIKKYMSALASSNTYFVEAKENLINRLDKYSKIHGSLAVVMLGLGFINPIIAAIGLTYVVPAVLFFLKKNNLAKL